MPKPQCTDHTVSVVDDQNDFGEVCRWECSACGRHGHWTPERERLLVARRGHAHTLRSRRPRPTKGGRRATTDEYQGLRASLNLGGGF